MHNLLSHTRILRFNQYTVIRKHRPKRLLCHSTERFSEPPLLSIDIIFWPLNWHLIYTHFCLPRYISLSGHQMPSCACGEYLRILWDLPLSQFSLLCLALLAFRSHLECNAQRPSHLRQFLPPSVSLSKHCCHRPGVDPNGFCLPPPVFMHLCNGNQNGIMLRHWWNDNLHKHGLPGDHYWFSNNFDYCWLGLNNRSKRISKQKENSINLWN